MNEEEKRRNRILNDILEYIGDISDLEYQKRVWLRGEGPECDDFTELCCNFFGTMRMVEREFEKYNFTPEQSAALLNFQDAFDRFSSEHSGIEGFVSEQEEDHEWAEVRKQASDVLKVFNHKKVGYKGRGYG